MMKMVDLVRSAFAKIARLIQPSSEEIKNESDGVVLCVTGIDQDVRLIFQMYDITKDEWYPETILPFSDWHEIYMYEGKIYVTTADETFLDVSTYDIATEKVDSIRVPTTCFLGLAGGIYNDYIYFINNGDQFINRYKISDNTVEEKVARMSESYEYEELLFFDGLLYIFGTLFSEFKESDCETYNTETHEIKPITPFPVSTACRRANVLSNKQQGYIAATEFEGKIYAIIDYTLRHLYVYCPIKNKWDIIVNECPPSIGVYGKLKKCGGKLLCIDFPGYIHVYHPENNTWDSRKDYNGVLTYMRFLGEMDKPSLKTERE